MEKVIFNEKTITPMEGRVLVQEVRPDFKVSENGILRPDTPSDRDLVYGIILKEGPGNPKPDLFTEGRTALFVEYSSAKVKVEEKIYRLLRYDDIIATIDRADDGESAGK